MSSLKRVAPVKKFSVGLLGVRGYVGEELVKIIVQHPFLDLSWVSSRQLEGKSLSEVYNLNSELIIENITPEKLAQDKVDVVILALPNGASQNFVKALKENTFVSVIIDLSADYRFDQEWQYALPETKNLHQGNNTVTLKDAKKWLSNPGCYATAMQLAIAPIVDLIKERPSCFGISGYSGAGTTPSSTNQKENLEDNIIPYKLVHHLHEKEASFHLDKKISFTPHVADFFRGISMTVQVEFNCPISSNDLFNRFNDYYSLHPLVLCEKEVPTIKQIVNTNYCLIGGFEVSKDGSRATLVSCLDNLLKGAASQAIQNINIALNIEPEVGLGLTINDFKLKQPA